MTSDPYNALIQNTILLLAVPADAPQNLQVQTTASDSIKLKWESPSNPNGVIITYSITWSPDNGTVDTPLTTYTLNGLLPCTTYTISVRAATSKGYGPPGDTSGVTQPGGGIVIPYFYMCTLYRIKHFELWRFSAC